MIVGIYGKTEHNFTGIQNFGFITAPAKQEALVKKIEEKRVKDIEMPGSFDSRPVLDH